MTTAVIDLTRPLGPSTPAWPGDVPFSRRWTTPPGAGPATVSCLGLSPHLGTHLDAPRHVDPEGADAASVPLAACVGTCEVVVVSGHDGPISRDDLPPGWAPAAPRVLFATGTWPAGTPIPPSFGSLAPELVEFLATAGVVLVGLDTPSVDAPSSVDLPAHRGCAARGIVILEGLDLAGAPPGIGTLVAAPLRLEGVEASPVRAILLTGAA